MSAISTYLEYIRSKIYAKDVRTAIVNAISQCYDDVNNPALQTDAMQRAVQAKIDAGQMAAYTVADGSFAGSKLANGAVTTAKLADGSVTTDKLANKAVTTAKLNDGSVTWQKLASGAVHTGELADSAVTNVKLADSSVSEGKLASGAVTTAKIADGAITADKLSSDIDFNVETDTTLTQSGIPADAKVVGDEIADLKSDLSYLYTNTDNRFDPNAITDEKYIIADGTIQSSATHFVTDYIPVSNGEALYFWGKNTSNVYANFTKRFRCAYDSSKQPVSSAGTNSESSGNPWIVPSGVAFVRYSIIKANVKGWTDLYCGLHPVGVDYEAYGKIPIDHEQVVENMNNIASLSDKLDSITEMSSNRFDPNAITDEKYIIADGTIQSSATHFVTDYIPVSNGEALYFWGKNTSNVYANFTKRFRCAYDSSKQPVSSAGTNSESSGNPWIVPSGVAFVRYSIIKANVKGWTDLYCGLHPVGVDYEAYGKIPKIPQTSDVTYSISNGDSLLEAVKYCYTNNIKNLIVEAGTYDIIEEYKDYYGSSYFDDYINYAQGDLFDAGIWLQNINVKFSAGAKVVCKYTGANTNVPDYFSAFATGNNVIIDGLVLDAENLRYGIHPDFNTGTEETYFIVKNSDLKHVKPTGNQAIGAGLGKHVFWQFENTIFRTVGNYYAMRIHNNVDSSAQSKVIVKDCYIDGDGFFLFNAYSTSTLQTIIQVCGCSYKTAPVVGRETQASNDNFTMIAWNNELRS